jgi:hypothetical protein
MKPLLQKAMVVPFLRYLFLTLGMVQVFISPLQADEVMNIDKAEDCGKIKGDTERLACFDTVIKGGIFNEQILKQVQIDEFGASTMAKEPAPAPAPATPPASAVATTPQAQPSAVPEQKTEPAATEGVSENRLDVTIVRLKKGNNSIYFFQTSDRQVWKQQNASKWNLKAPFEARIKKGAMGSYFLVTDGGLSTRIKRVK